MRLVLCSSHTPQHLAVRQSIAEETAVGFDDSDDDAVVAARRKAGVRATGRNASDARVDSVTDDLQFSLALDEDL